MPDLTPATDLAGPLYATNVKEIRTTTTCDERDTHTRLYLYGIAGMALDIFGDVAALSALKAPPDTQVELTFTGTNSPLSVDAPKVIDDLEYRFQND